METEMETVLRCVMRYREQDDVDLRYMAVRELCGELRNRQDHVLHGLDGLPGTLKAVTHEVIVRSLDDQSVVQGMVCRELLAGIGDCAVPYVVAQLVAELGGRGKGRRWEVVLQYLRAVLGGGGKRARDVEEDDIAAYVRALAREREPSALWHRVLAALCSGGAVQSDELVEGVFAEAERAGGADARGAFVEVVGGVGGGRIARVLARCGDAELLEQVARAHPLKFGRVWPAVVQRWALGELGSGPAGFQLVRHLCVLMLRADAELLRAVCARCAEALATAASWHAEPAVCGGVTADDEADDLQLSDEGSELMLSEDEDQGAARQRDCVQLGASAAALLGALPSVPPETVQAVQRLPESFLVELRPQLVALTVRHTAFVDWTIRLFRDVAQEALPQLSPEQTAQLAAEGAERSQFLAASNSIPTELRAAVYAQADSGSVQTELLQQWQNRRDASKQYVDSTLQLVVDLLALESVSLNVHQWCIDMLSWVGDEYAFYRATVIPLMIPTLKPPKRFVHVMQVGTMKQREDESTHIRALVARALLSWLGDAAISWEYNHVTHLLELLKYPLRDAPLKGISLDILETAVERYGGLLAHYDAGLVQSAIEQASSQYPTETSHIAARYAVIASSL
ncbi:AaceriAEL037Wp [[Ashbya] aceris (nom. inval.)]|nr:AaceriAEL037Wp [[Ashbya] aceris (nom. inval.)]